MAYLPSNSSLTSDQMQAFQEFLSQFFQNSAPSSRYTDSQRREHPGLAVSGVNPALIPPSVGGRGNRGNAGVNASRRASYTNKSQSRDSMQRAKERVSVAQAKAAQDRASTDPDAMTTARAIQESMEARFAGKPAPTWASDWLRDHPQNKERDTQPRNTIGFGSSAVVRGSKRTPPPPTASDRYRNLPEGGSGSLEGKEAIRREWADQNLDFGEKEALSPEEIDEMIEDQLRRQAANDAKEAAGFSASQAGFSAVNPNAKAPEEPQGPGRKGARPYPTPDLPISSTFSEGPIVQDNVTQSMISGLIPDDPAYMGTTNEGMGTDGYFGSSVFNPNTFDAFNILKSPFANRSTRQAAYNALQTGSARNLKRY
jgi:hypothetical protein